MNALKHFNQNVAGVKYLIIGLLLILSAQTANAQHFSNLYYDRRPSMLFGSIKSYGENYYVTGVTDNKNTPYYEKALFGRIRLDGSVDSIYSIVDSNKRNYALFDNNLRRTADGNFITCGFIDDSLERAFIMKIDTAGNILLWHEYTDTATRFFQAMDVLEIPGQGYMLLINANYNSKAYVLVYRTDTLGDTINQNLKHQSGNTVPWIMSRMLNGHYMIGSANSKQGNTPFWTQTWLIEIDSSGNTERSWLDADAHTGWPLSMLQTSDSGWIITRQRMDFDVADFQQFKASVLKMDKNFNRQWELVLGDSSDATGFYDVQALPDGNFVACGTTPTWGYDSAYYWGWLIKFDSSGNVIWDRKFPGMARYGAESNLSSLEVLPNGDLLACGQVDLTVDIGITPIQYGWIVRTDSLGCVLENCFLTDLQEPKPIKSLNIKIYPNPAGNECLLKIDEPRQMQSASIFDNVGREVMPLFNNQQLSIFNINCNPLSPDLYFVRVVNSDGEVGIVKFVKQ